MRFPLACLPLVLVSGSLLAADDRSDFHWIQVQGGITDHRTKNPDHQQPAIGFGVGTWVNGHLGLEGSGVLTHVNYGHGSAKEAHATASLLINPFRTPAALRPFLRLGLGSTTIGTPISGTGSATTRLSGVVGLGVQALLGDQMFCSLEGRLVQIAFLQGPMVEKFNYLPIMLKRLTLTGSTLRPRTVAQKAAVADALRAKVWPLLESGAVKPLIHATFPMEQTREAHALMESSAHLGKIMVTTGR